MAVWVASGRVAESPFAFGECLLPLFLLGAGLASAEPADGGESATGIGLALDSGEISLDP
ncbi:hypothetical protein [Microbacterium sp.]|uniref:hypothetical protein n=1 Tax=Microbacterium sp. TaxID=51671 RepID=UPI0039E72AAC